MVATKELPFILASTFFGNAAAQRFAIGKLELTGIGPFGHNLQRRIAPPAEEGDAHEAETQSFRLGFDQLRQCGDIRHPRPSMNMPLREPAPEGTDLGKVTNVEKMTGI